MKTDSPLHGNPQSPRSITLLVLLVPLAVLAFLSLKARETAPQNLFLVSPLEDSSFSFDLQKLARLCGEEFILSYEIRRQLDVSTGFAEYPVTAVGTNSLYPALVPCFPEQGSFFSAAAEEEKSRHAVLNSAAAGLLFGAVSITGRSFRMEAEPWLVCGVVDDGEENPQVYIPASVRGEGPRSLMVLTGGGIDGEKIRDTLKTLGAGGSSHRFLEVSQSAVLGLRFGVAILTLACTLPALFVLGRRLQTTVPGLQPEHTASMIRRGVQLLRRASGPIALSAGACLTLNLARRLLTACLRWKDLPSPEAVISNGDFPAKLRVLPAYDRAEFAVFTLFLAVLAVCCTREFLRNGRVKA